MSSDSCCLEAKLKITKFVETFEKSSPASLTAKYTLEQLDVLDHVEEALLSGFYDESLNDQLDQISLKMWRNVMYPQIDYIRKQLSTLKDEDERRDLAQQLDTIILSHVGRISNLMTCFTEGKREKFESKAFLIDAFGEKQRKLLVRLLTFSGDLIRYRCSNNTTFNSFDHFQSAKEFYELGNRLNPADGSIFNQLAVIESLSPTKSIPMMIYLYSRALGSLEPFPIAKENLCRLLKKFGNLFSCLLNITEGVADLDEMEKMLKNYTGDEHLLYAAALALGKYFNVQIPFMVHANLEMSILNGQAQVIPNDPNQIDFKFVSTLIGSSFISESIQMELIKLFNNSDDDNNKALLLFHSLSGQHEPIQLPMSQ